MLIVEVLSMEMWDEGNNKFVYTPPGILELEHSLVSLSKWEEKWHKAFLKENEKTVEESIDYVRCMTLNEVDPDVYKGLTNKNIEAINEYIRDPMTATTFGKEARKGPIRQQIITNEIIYYWMTALQIPFDPCQYWHLNKLFALIKVCSIKNSPPKKASKEEILKRNRALNESRRKAANSKG